MSDWFYFINHAITPFLIVIASVAMVYGWYFFIRPVLEKDFYE